MGFNRIYLIGCDLDNSKQAYHGSVKLDISEEYRLETQRLYDQIHQWLQWFAAEGQHHGIKTYSCSPNSRINTYLDYRSYLDVIDERERMIDRGQPLYCPTDVEDRLKKTQSVAITTNKNKADKKTLERKNKKAA
jgi:hypothetical protein